MTSRAVTALASVALATALLAAGCTPGGDRDVLTVFAASSLTEAFGTLEERFAAEHPGVEVRVNFGGSARLAHQLREGARADVFAAADPESMRVAVAAGRIDSEPAELVRNHLVIAVAGGNPEGIDDVTDLARADLHVVTCAAQVPCGRATRRVLQQDGVELRPSSEELSVKAVLHKVRLGEADAGLVYRTDVRAAAGEVDAVPVPDTPAAITPYRIAVTADASQPELAAEFQRFALGPHGRAVFAEAGFEVPDG
ncbi:molybdate ABC transporter substrate-binding protein [Haloechinothrix sp. LS1_15]|uniref:molybdate ABC transporter substrate-binding protein n=1 Tax=Haloechinothrix sp. LS1_15 TaxID=2652248 RepID=UPI0029461B3B|nr:molybdate ABC transporter substrate-binding protein [Haloechinothrix sp. LS1_15]MDV6014378.1 molybdate ABC transporter substrate-binding protein [Haloechinothrix sp. LS1_15]